MSGTALPAGPHFRGKVPPSPCAQAPNRKINSERQGDLHELHLQDAESSPPKKALDQIAAHEVSGQEKEECAAPEHGSYRGVGRGPRPLADLA